MTNPNENTHEPREVSKAIPEAGALGRLIDRMGAVGLLLERSPGLFTINPYLDALVQKTLRGKGLL